MNSARNYTRTLICLGAGSALLACMSRDHAPTQPSPSQPSAQTPSEPEAEPGEESRPPSSSEPAALPTHTGLISIQDVSIANQPAAGHGLTVTALFTPWAAADYE
jgi:hypothetical protein